MRRSCTVLLLGLASVALATGCGGASRPSAALGRQVFASSCSVCHGLSGAESARKQGGDLAAFTMSEAQLESETRVMPVVHRPLSDAEVRAVSQYVLGVQRAYARRPAHR